MLYFTQFLDDELAKFGDGINQTTYAEFLQGKIWDDRMNEIDYDSVTPQFEDYLLGVSKFNQHWEGSVYDHTISQNKQDNAWKPEFHVSYRGYGEKCTAFDIPYIPDETYSAYTLQFRTSIFPNGIRPETVGENAYGLRVFFHYPNHMLRAVIGRRTWDSHDVAAPKRYSMVFHINQVEVLIERNKNEHPCHKDWQTEDQRLMQEHMDVVGCRPTHWKLDTSLQKCSTKEQMRQFKVDFKTTHYHKSCKTTQKMLYAYEEFHAIQDYIMGKVVIKNDSMEVAELAMYFQDSTYLEIQHAREYSIQSLVGNAGGYMGLFLGYAVLQMPHFLVQIFVWFKKDNKLSNFCQNRRKKQKAKENVKRKKRAFEKAFENTNTNECSKKLIMFGSKSKLLRIQSSRKGSL